MPEKVSRPAFGKWFANRTWQKMQGMLVFLAKAISELRIGRDYERLFGLPLPVDFGFAGFDA